MNVDQACRVSEALEGRLRRTAKVATSRFPKTLRAFLTALLGLTLSPVFAAICDASDGVPVELDETTCMATFGCKPEELPSDAPKVVVVRAGGRAGKSARLLAGKAIEAAVNIPLPTLGKGEHAWALIVAPRSDLAMQTLNYIRGFIEANDELRAMVVNGRRRARTGELITVGTKTVITLRRPDGKLVDIRTGVASAGGTWGRGKTFVFVGFDESEFFGSDEDKKFNDRELYQAAVQRIVPEGQLWMVSTPWIEGYGVMEELIATDWGRHDDALIVQAPTRAMNPTWDPDGKIERHMRKTDPENAAREIDAIPLAAGSKLFFPPALIEAAINRARVGADMHLEHVKGLRYCAGGDLGFRKNSSALAIACSEIDSERHAVVVKLAFHLELKPARNEALKTDEVCEAFARKCASYDCYSLLGDIIYAPFAIDAFDRVRIHNDATGKSRSVAYVDFNPSTEAVSGAFTKLRALMAAKCLELPHDEKMLAQLRRVTAVPTPGGSVKIVLPRLGTSHGDVVMALALAVLQVETREPIPVESTARGERTMEAGGRQFGDRGRKKLRGGLALPGGY